MEHLTWHTTSGIAALRAPHQPGADFFNRNLLCQPTMFPLFLKMQMETYDANLRS